MERPVPYDRRSVLAALAVAGGAAVWGLSPNARASAVFTPESFGHFGDGRGDAAPAINAAINAACLQGGGIVRFRPGRTYILREIVAETGITTDQFRASIAIPASAANVTLDLNGATLLQASDALTFGTPYRMFNDRQLRRSVVPMTGQPARGDTWITLAHSAAVSVGDVVMVMSGNTGPSSYLPVAEMVVVTGIEGRRVHFDRALAKDHLHLRGHPLGMMILSDRFIRDFSILGPGRIVNRQRRCGNVFQALGLTIEGVTFEGRGGMAVRGRDIAVRDCRSRIQADWSKPVFRPYCLALDTGTSHASIRNLSADGGSNVTYLHLHEGLADIQVEDLRITNGSTASALGEEVAAISILGTSWNISIDTAHVAGNPQGAGLEARESRVMPGGNRQLSIRNLRLAGDFASTPVIVEDHAPARLASLDLRDAVAPRGGPRMRIRGADHEVTDLMD